MRTSIIIAFLIISSLINSVNAQWYYTKYGVDELNDLTDAQLMESYSNARASSIGGGVATGTGIALMLSGFAKATANIAEDFLVAIASSFGTDSPPSSQSYGGGLALSGAVLTIGGAALWISGGSRKKLLRPIMKSRGLGSSISVYPDAGYDLLSHTYYPAVTFKIEF